MLALGISGSPRPGGNTDALLNMVADLLRERGVDVEVIALRNLSFSPCTSCRTCLREGRCVINDDFTRILVPKLLATDIILVASPVYFNNVSALTKAFIDRTWCLRGRLRYKVGGAIVVGRGYGLELAIAAIHAFMLKHCMVIAHRGLQGIGFEIGEVLSDERISRDAKNFVDTIVEVARVTTSLRRGAANRVKNRC